MLERIAESTGVSHALEVVFEDNGGMVDVILTLAILPYLTKFCFSFVARWQHIAKLPCDFPLTPKAITALMQSIIKSPRQEFLSLRAKKLKGRKRCIVAPRPSAAVVRLRWRFRWGQV